MSYNTFLPSGRFVSEYQLYDIAAIQSYYGQNLATASGDTAYTLSSFTNSAQLTDASNNRYYSVWDAGGNDTIDVSAATTSADAAFIDLRPAHFSSIGHNTGITLTTGVLTNAGIENTSLAFGTVIENVVGTAYNDVIVGSALTTSLNGGAGNDVIYGSGAAVRLAKNLGANVGVIASDDGDYGYFNATGYHARTVSADISHTINGGDGNDVIFGSNGGDNITGGYGSDEIYGGIGNDTIDSGPNLNANGVSDGDLIYSGGGKDTIYARTSVHLDAGLGDDIVHVIGGLAVGTLGDGNDSIDFSNAVATSVVNGGLGNDKFTVTDSSPMTLSGDAGNDYFIISGSAGAGIEGGSGNELYDFSSHNAGNVGTSQLQFHSGWGSDTVRESTSDGYARGGSTTGQSHWHIDTIQFIDNANSSLTIEWNPTVYDSITSPLFGGTTTYYGYGDVAVFDASGDSVFFGGVNGSWSEGGFGSTFNNTATLDITNINGTSVNANNFTFVKGDPSSYNSYPGSSVPSLWSASPSPSSLMSLAATTADTDQGSASSFSTHDWQVAGHIVEMHPHYLF